MKELFSTIAETAEKPIYLVGGAVRDFLMGRETNDFDFAYMGNAYELAEKIKNKFNAAIVPLDNERDIIRVVIKEEAKYLNLDFAGMKGKEIFEDLKQRDFTINAMALPLGKDISEIIDPLQGRKAIVEKKIIAVSEDNLITDPLRILRAIRFSVQMNFEITGETYIYLKKYAHLLANVAAERIREELFKAFAVDAYKCITLLFSAGIIKVLFPEMHKAVGVKQNKYHTLDVWHHILEVVRQLEQNILRDAAVITEDINDFLAEEVASGHTRKTLLKFAAFLHDVGKPVVKKQHPVKGVVFWNHEHVGAEMAREIAHRLAFSKKETAFIVNVVKYHMRPLFMVNAKFTKKSAYKFFEDTGKDGLAVILHALADMLGGKTPDPEKERALREVAKNLTDFYFHDYLPKIKNPLITGKDIIENIPGVLPDKIGKLLKTVEQERILGNLQTRGDALAYLFLNSKKILS